MQSRILFEFVWMFVLDRAIDDIPDRSERALPELRTAYQGLPWYRVYDLIEYIGQRNANLVNCTQFRGTCNDVFRKYSSAYRFVSGLIVPVTSEAEISAVEGAISVTSEGPIRTAAAHIQAALGHLANRELPDYRNSAKESISAVESVCKVLAGTPGADLT